MDTPNHPEIAVFAGPQATILNGPPLLTGHAHLRPQRLAEPVTVRVEAFTAHPLERDAADLYDSAPDPTSPPSYSIDLHPDDGLYLLPYAGRRRDGSPWQSPDADAGPNSVRQTFYPDASRVYEEIDRFAIDGAGRGRLLSSLARFSFYRPAPPGGYTRADPGAERFGNPTGERWGEDFFPYAPNHLRAEPDTRKLADITNQVSQVLSDDRFAGAQWLESSPSAEETLYWLSLLIDTRKPLVGHVAQRSHQSIGADGPRNIVDGVRYIVSRAWASVDGTDHVGPVLIGDELAFAARDVVKTGGRPGSFFCEGGLGGPVASIDRNGQVEVGYLPNRAFTWGSKLRLQALPALVEGVKASNGFMERVPVRVKQNDGELRPSAVPSVTVVTYSRYGHANGACADPDPGIDAWRRHNLEFHPLSGFVSEGRPAEAGTDLRTEAALRRAVFSGMPVVECGRVYPSSFALRPPDDVFISGSNLSAGKARILLMACLLALGAFPPARDPGNPAPEEIERAVDKKRRYQEFFDTH